MLKDVEGGKAMFVFPAFITPATASIIGVFLAFIVIPIVVLITFLVWHVRKIKSIDGTLREILERMRNN